ncbi:hypothetical protein PybrP1_005891 [[Pythium] brassicae (nom. inval.)]|nr:hypothetical protein PybrP1_005891 [[Pythium] brassicae (nom. inval.)]
MRIMNCWRLRLAREPGREGGACSFTCVRRSLLWKEGVALLCSRVACLDPPHSERHELITTWRRRCRPRSPGNPDVAEALDVVEKP